MQSSEMSARVLIVVPIYNEAPILESSLLRLHLFCSNRLKNIHWNIVIADNGSTDTSEVIGRHLAGQLPNISYVKNATRGRGGALKAVWSMEDADVYLYMDSDLATDLSHILDLIRLITVEKYDIAIGSRLIRGASTTRSFLRECYSRVYSVVPRFFFPSFPVHDCQCGFKALSRRVKKELLPLVQDTQWFFDTELLILAFLKNYRIAELPVHWLDQRFAKRKSKVKLLSTALGNIRKLIRLKLQAKRHVA